MAFTRDGALHSNYLATHTDAPQSLGQPQNLPRRNCMGQVWPWTTPVCNLLLHFRIQFFTSAKHCGASFWPKPADQSAVVRAQIGPWEHKWFHERSHGYSTVILAVSPKLTKLSLTTVSRNFLVCVFFSCCRWWRGTQRLQEDPHCLMWCFPLLRMDSNPWPSEHWVEGLGLGIAWRGF